MTQRRKRNSGGVSWELLGIVAVLGIFLVGFIFYIASPADAIKAPEFSSLDPAWDGEGEPGSVVAHGVDEDGRPYLGDEDAPIVFYEFADFQCPHCRDFTTGIGKDIKRDYLASGKAKLVWVNATFIGAESEDASEAALCASDQGLFWPVHDYIFANQSPLQNQGGFSVDRLAEMTVKAGGDEQAFRACMSSDEKLDIIAADRSLLTESGVERTPSFLVGDLMIVGSDGLKLREALDGAAPSE